MSSEISEVVAGQVNERFLEVPTNSTYFADLATLNAAQSGAQNPFDAVVREVVDLRAAAGNMSAFDSRYAPTADATLWINARDMASWTGTPAEAKHGPAAWNAWKLDASTDEGITFMAYIPTWWSTFHMDVYWANDGAGAGDVRWLIYRDAIVAGDTINSVGASAGSTATADIEDDLVVSRVLTSITNTGGPAWWFAVMRDADNAADTLANDIGVLGVLLTRAS